MELSIEQIRLKELYDFLAPERRLRIVDVGANPVETPAYRDLIEQNLAELWAFEPSPEPFERLRSEVGPNVEVLPYAVGDGNEHTLNVYQGNTNTSLLKHNRKLLKLLDVPGWNVGANLLEQIPLQTVTLDERGGPRFSTIFQPDLR